MKEYIKNNRSIRLERAGKGVKITCKDMHKERIYFSPVKKSWLLYFLLKNFLGMQESEAHSLTRGK